MVQWLGSPSSISGGGSRTPFSSDFIPIPSSQVPKYLPFPNTPGYQRFLYRSDYCPSRPVILLQVGVPPPPADLPCTVSMTPGTAYFAENNCKTHYPTANPTPPHPFHSTAHTSLQRNQATSLRGGKRNQTRFTYLPSR